jgi:trk system potassium uptake protein TrkA
MNIIILGAGRVGERAAESLVSEKSDITVIDTDQQRLRRLQDRLDLRCVVGNGIQPSVLEQAGIRDVDMLIGCAATGGPLMDKAGFAIHRQEAVMAELHGQTRIQPCDEVFVLAPTEQIRTWLAAMHRAGQRPVHRIMVAGGGWRQCRPAPGPGKRGSVPGQADRSRFTALRLHGDPALFLALTNDDEDNIMSCLPAKCMGARRVLALINRKAYANLVQGSQIDIAISPAQAVIGELLAHVRRGDIAAVHSLRRGASEALEAIVRGDAKSSRLVGRRIDRLELPPGVQMGALVRGLDRPDGTDAGGDATPRILMAHHDLVIEPLDHMIVFVPRKRLLREVEMLFQVSATFF